MVRQFYLSINKTEIVSLPAMVYDNHICNNHEPLYDQAWTKS